jgi:hypothetical protein
MASYRFPGDPERERERETRGTTTIDTVLQEMKMGVLRRQASHSKVCRWETRGPSKTTSQQGLHRYLPYLSHLLCRGPTSWHHRTNSLTAPQQIRVPGCLTVPPRPNGGRLLTSNAPCCAGHLVPPSGPKSKYSNNGCRKLG